jgi:hypothetical protein
LVTSKHRPPLIRIEQVPIVSNDAGRAREHQGLYPSLLAGLDHRRRAINIDLLQQIFVRVVIRDRRGRVDDNVGLHIFEDGGETPGVGDVALVVGGVGVAVALAAEVDGGDRLGPPVEGLVDDVMAEEAIAADDEDAAEVASFLAGGELLLEGAGISHCCRSIWARRPGGSEIARGGELQDGATKVQSPATEDEPR